MNVTTIAGVPQPDPQRDIGATFADFGPFDQIVPNLGGGTYTSSLDVSSNTPTLDDTSKLVATRRISYIEEFDALPSSSMSPYIVGMGGTQPEITTPVKPVSYAFSGVGFNEDDSGALDVFPKHVGPLPRIQSSSLSNALDSSPSGDSVVALFEAWMDYEPFENMTSSV